MQEACSQMHPSLLLYFDRYYLFFGCYRTLLQFFSMLSISWKETRKHQMNLSASKATFAFPKDKRFKHKDSPLCHSIYNIPSCLGKAPASGIGKGNKLQLINASVATPSPLSYHVKSEFQLAKKGNRFGLGRQNIKYNGIFNKSETPEPGHYQISTGLATKRGFTIYSKLNMQQPSNARNPGPGHYKSGQSLNTSGRYVLSQVTNCPGYKIKDGKDYSSVNLTPGPGQYESKGQTLNKLGTYPNSKHESSRCRIFSRSLKNIEPKRSIPGPGSYNCYSEFGLRI